MGGSWLSRADQAARCLEQWDVAGARDAASAARSLAAGWGDAEGVAICDVLAARAALLVSSKPNRSLLALDRAAAAVQTPRLNAALARFETELAAAHGPDLAPPSAVEPLAADSPADAIAAAVLVAVMRSADAHGAPPRIAGAQSVIGRDDAGGWPKLVAAIEAEAAGASGLPAIDAALAIGQAEAARAVIWTALALRASLAARRGAGDEQRRSLDRMRALVESWALELGRLDALSALARPDRARVEARETPSPDVKTANGLVDVALALARERDVERLAQIALDAAVAVTRAERGLLLLKEASSYRVAASRYVDERAERQGVVGLSSTIAQRAIAAGEIVISNDVRGDPALGDCASLALEVTALLCAPILTRSEIQGALYLDRRGAGRPFDDAAVGAARAIGSMLASALFNARVIADLEAQSRELEHAREELAHALASRTVERDDMRRQLADAHDVFPASATLPSATAGLVGRGPQMSRLLRTIERVAASDAPVLILGETGSGKELVARALHSASARRDRPFVAINCGALSENLLESELFGAERGAYTSAIASRPGLFVAAHGGTLLLDEVGDMPPAMQAALLRVLETSEIRPVGSTRSRTVDVRVLAASHTDLVRLVSEGKFRDDLRYRLEVVQIEVPALRTRLADLPELCEHLLADVRRRYNLPACRLSKDALEMLGRRSWPGNVRELRHVLASAALSAAESAILPADLPPERVSVPPPASAFPNADSVAIREDGHQARVESIRGALRATAGHRGRAAQLLGISRSTFYRYLEMYRIDPTEFEHPTGDDRAH
jgi:transcriptional regulator with GAF, ATPase, and Fis domain